ncbi:MAG TPA: AAA family ATPase [Atribacterota bacterium]|nr:AAA family ATPase [Atribacterota bacterium]
MKIISIFNNKGGVGKTTLTYHLAYALSEIGKKVLLIDLDPQSNLTLYGLSIDDIHDIWEEENPFIEEGFESTIRKIGEKEFNRILHKPKTIHFLLKPTEEGINDFDILPPLIDINNNLKLLPGRLTLHMYENKISVRWNDSYSGDPLSIKTINKIRDISKKYSDKNNFDFVIIDTSPNLGSLNKVIISTVDGFIIPALPDMFSLYGIRNIGNSLKSWKENFDTIYKLISEEKRKQFPENFVRFLGYTIYNARKYSRGKEWDLAQAHYNFARQIPSTIKQYINEDIRKNLSEEMINSPIGGICVMHTHNTLPSMAQKYRNPMWKIPTIELDPEDSAPVTGNRIAYLATQENYKKFAEDLLKRINTL